jgi:hypothetical protein
MKRVSKDRLVDINDELVNASVHIDDGCDHTKRLVWKMNGRRDMRNGVSVPMPPAPKVAAVKIEPKKKPRKRDYQVMQKAISTV